MLDRLRRKTTVYLSVHASDIAANLFCYLAFKLRLLFSMCVCVYCVYCVSCT